MHEEDDDLLRARLNSETGRLCWNELERHFARGVVIRVAGEEDLIEVAFRMVRDDKPALEKWLTSGRVARASADEAVGWSEREAEFWAVVAAPWVLVQEIKAEA